MIVRKFKVGEVIRCKKKFSALYGEANMDALCKVVSYNEYQARRYVYVDGKRKRMCENLHVKIIAHKKEGNVGMTFDVYDYHFKKMTKRDEDTFILYRM